MRGKERNGPGCGKDRVWGRRWSARPAGELRS